MNRKLKVTEAVYQARLQRLVKFIEYGVSHNVIYDAVTLVQKSFEPTPIHRKVLELIRRITPEWVKCLSPEYRAIKSEVKLLTDQDRLR